MVGTSKILTVSYGTFSCTLEGFDDSFDTMKAIAEYFRGLASDDRYFGAEPPTPDAEMLAKIAEREISRRVDARMDDGGIVLRAAALTDQSDVPDAAADSEIDAERKAAKAERKAEKAAQKSKDKADARAARDADKAKADADKKAAEDAHTAAKAKAVAAIKADAAAKADAKAEADAKDAEDDRDTATSEGSLVESVSAATADASEGRSGSKVEETRDVALSSTLAAKDPAPENTDLAQTAAPTIVPAHPDAESMAAKLQRIRAVVGNSGIANKDTSDDLTSQFLPQTTAPDVADVQTGAPDDLVADFDAHEAELDGDVSGQTVPDDAAQIDTPSSDAADTDDGSDMISRVMARHSDADQPSNEADAADATDEPAQPRARVIRMKRADFDKAVAEGDLEAYEDDDAPEEDDVAPVTGPDFGLLDGADDLDDYLEDSDFTDSDLSIDVDTDFADDLKAIEDDGSDDVEDEAIVADTATDEVSNDLPPQDEAIEVEDEPAVEVSDAAAFLAHDPDVDDAALDRLMSESDAQMQEPAGSRRRDAIAQLKAAVAAKEAARQVGEPDDDDQDVENAFRNDLSEAVRPEGGARPRPVVRTDTTRTERPRPAPLKLVAAQRVDLDTAAAERDGPVVPRRVSAIPKDEAATRASGSFAEFADNMGATELPDLLEAAAAYTSFVEGADEFSRPQILRRVRAVASDDFKREDELRSFAALISAGRFTKVRNGRFQVADDSRFNPERRAG